MEFLDKVERKVVFPAVRIIALICIGVLLITAVISLGDHLINESFAARPVVEKVVKKKQQLTDNISAIITEVEKQTEDPIKVVAAVKEYATGALDQLKDGIVVGTLKRLDWVVSVLFITGSLALAGIFCLVLSLLAVERNTRDMRSGA